MSIQYRQGDVLLVKVQWLPPGAVQERNLERVVLAQGEATGHAHAIASASAVAFSNGGDRYVKALPGAMLVHEEHGAIDLEPGLYRVIRQREYSGWSPAYVND